MQFVAVTVQDGETTEAVARKALDVSSVVVADMTEATRSGRASAIVAATVDVYSGITEYLDSSNDADESPEQQDTTEQINSLKRELKARATDFCDSLTDSSAPDADPLSGLSEDFLFSCQKIQTKGQTERGENAALDKAVIDGMEFKTSEGYTYKTLPLSIEATNSLV